LFWVRETSPEGDLTSESLWGYFHLAPRILSESILSAGGLQGSRAPFGPRCWSALRSTAARLVAAALPLATVAFDVRVFLSVDVFGGLCLVLLRVILSSFASIIRVQYRGLAVSLLRAGAFVLEVFAGRRAALRQRSGWIFLNFSRFIT
jgi:hypothetical protein